jgi:hypothetical protein
MTHFLPGRTGQASRAVAVALFAMSGVLAFSGAALAADPSATPSSSPAPSATPTPPSSLIPTPPLVPSPAPPRLSYLSDLATTGSYVGQFNFVQCVGASVQMMRNMILDRADHSPYVQHLLWYRARHWSRYSGDGGADPFGWAAVLTFTSAGPYRVYAGRSVADTLHAAARAMALSSRPIGVTVWHGSHAWVISGITATNDPARTNSFTVLKVSVTDPLWTLLHQRRGIMAPSTWLTVAQFQAVFSPYHDASRDRAIEGRYVAILPVPTVSELTLTSGRSVFSFGSTGP